VIRKLLLWRHCLVFVFGRGECKAAHCSRAARRNLIASSTMSFSINWCGDWKLTRKIRGQAAENSRESRVDTHHQFLMVPHEGCEYYSPPHYEAMVFIGYDNASRTLCRALDRRVRRPVFRNAAAMARAPGNANQVCL